MSQAPEAQRPRWPHSLSTLNEQALQRIMSREHPEEDR